MAIEPLFDSGGHFGGGFAVVRHSNKNFVIDRTGRAEWVPYHTVLGKFSEGLAVAAYIDSALLKGYIGATTGHHVIAPQYLEAEPFSEGFARVKLTDGNWIYIDKNGVEFYNADDSSKK